MRKQDKQYIANLAEHLVGRSLMQGVESQASSFTTPWELRPLLEPTLKPKIAIMSVGKLGEIIQYSDVGFRGQNSTLICREEILNPMASAQVAELAARCVHRAGKDLLEFLTLLTILAVVFDMIKQLEYDQEEDAEWERA